MDDRFKELEKRLRDQEREIFKIKFGAGFLIIGAVGLTAFEFWTFGEKVDASVNKWIEENVGQEVIATVQKVESRANSLEARIQELKGDDNVVTFGQPIEIYTMFAGRDAGTWRAPVYHQNNILKAGTTHDIETDRAFTISRR